ncbi:MAG: hypothetical protein KKE12_17735 [Proteobacteria bacterium]|nr:hypothetical protein [Pseudomonadota bacterium]
MNWQKMLDGQKATVKEIKNEILNLKDRLREITAERDKLSGDLERANRDLLAGHITDGEAEAVKTDYTAAARNVDTLQSILADLNTLAGDMEREEIKSEINEIDKNLAEHQRTMNDFRRKLVEHFVKAGIAYQNVTGHPAKMLDYSYIISNRELPALWREEYERGGGLELPLADVINRLSNQKAKLEEA